MQKTEISWRCRRGLTLVEMAAAMLASSVMFLAVVGVLASSHKQWNQTYERVHGEMVTDAYVTRQTFDRIVRQACSKWCYPMTGVNSTITLFLYNNIQNLATTPPLNRYARFRLDGANLLLEQGPIAMSVTGTPDSTQVLAHNVTSCQFWRSGPCIHLAMVLHDGTTTLPVAMTATRNNP